MTNAYLITILLLYKLTIIFGTVYVVWNGSNWWALLLVFAFISFNDNEKYQ